MSEMRNELEASAQKVFPSWEEARDADAAWSQIAELGWFMAGVPEECGGLGLLREDLAVVFLELGRAIVPGAAIAQFMAIEAMVGAGEGAVSDDLLESAMAGELVTASLTDGAALDAVPDADKAEWVLSRGQDEVALVSLDGATLTKQDTWDQTRRLFAVTPADGAERIVLANGEDAAALDVRVDGLLSLALAGDSLGGAAAVLDVVVEYLKTRRQFDRPLAMFQALKHRAANCKAAIETAESLYRQRAEDGSDAMALGALKAHCCTVYKEVAEEAIQFLGGIGLTIEHPGHLFLKRAFLNAMLGGSADAWTERAGRALLADVD